MLHFNAPGETTIVITRKHWFMLFRDLFVLAVVFLLPFLLYALLRGSFFALPLSLPPLSPALATFLVALWTLVTWMRLYHILTHYFLDIWIITDKRIVSIDQIHFFNRRMSNFRLERIQDVTVHAEGIIATLLGYGNLLVQSAGVEQEFIIRGIPNPQHMKDTIMKHHDAVVEPAPKDGIS